MFNVAVLKMKDIIKYFIGITTMLLVAICITRYFNEETDKTKVIQELRNQVKVLSENNILKCFDKVLPSSTIVNEEYSNIANEDEKIEENKLLQEVLKTQISSIRGLEEMEEEQTQKQEVEVANQEKDNQQTEEKVQLARNRIFYANNYKQSY